MSAAASPASFSGNSALAVSVLKRVWEDSLDGMRLTDENGNILRVNGAFCQMVGKSTEELVGQSFTVIYESKHRESTEAKHRMRFSERDVAPLFERELLLWDGTKVWFELSNSFLEIEGYGAVLLSIFRDISERKAAEETMREFSEKLERSNRELQDFAYVASHDLQEPLRKVAVFADRLKAKHGEALGEEGLDYLARMQNAALRMQALINDLLSFSRVASKSQPFAPVDLGKVAREVLDDLETRIEQLGASLEIGDLPTIDAEPFHMRQLLQNLIGNALKFNRPDEKPVVRVNARIFTEKVDIPSHSVSRKMAEISVSDNGIGFDEKYLDRIFQVFQRLHSRSAYEGTGMGLAITRKIVEHHGGQITATSKPGEGSTFVVTIPMQQQNSKSLI
ncbi:MAG: PAS domain S-box protein [Verrucomicrobia bacterium]|nr:PAS domain S-box protein [Verrucomicrobiota bacterium]